MSNCGIDYAFTLLIGGLVEIRIETDFTMSSPEGEVGYDPQRTSALAPLLSLHQAEVKAVTVAKTGIVLVEFVDGRVLRVEPHEQYESCSVTWHGPRGENRSAFYVLPGGRIAAFKVAD